MCVLWFISWHTTPYNIITITLCSAQECGNDKFVRDSRKGKQRCSLVHLQWKLAKRMDVRCSPYGAEEMFPTSKT